MRVILNEDIPHLGQRGDVKRVAAGYGRNYLIPKGLAYEETPANRARFREAQKKWEERMLRERASAEAAARALEAVSLRFERKAGDEGVLFGSVTSVDMARELAAKGVEIDKRKILLDEPIKRTGTFKVPIHFHRDVTVEISVEVAPEGGAAPAPARAAVEPAATEAGSEAEGDAEATSEE